MRTSLINIYNHWSAGTESYVSDSDVLKSIQALKIVSRIIALVK